MSGVIAFTVEGSTPTTGGKNIRSVMDREERNRLMLDAYARGEKVSVVCTRYKISYQGFAKLRRRMGVTPRPTGGPRTVATPECLIKFREMYLGGIPSGDIRVALGMSEPTVSRVARELGLTVRPRGGARPQVKSGRTGRNRRGDKWVTPCA